MNRKILADYLASIIILAIAIGAVLDPQHLASICLAILLELAVVYAIAGTIVLLEEARNRIQKGFERNDEK